MRYLLLLLLCGGCAFLHSETEDADGVRTSVKIFTLFDSSSQVTKFANRGSTVEHNQWPAGTTIGTLNEQSSGSNVVNVISAVAEGVAKGVVSGVK